jgi:hypothetical protein
MSMQKFNMETVFLDRKAQIQTVFFSILSQKKFDGSVQYNVVNLLLSCMYRDWGMPVTWELLEKPNTKLKEHVFTSVNAWESSQATQWNDRWNISDTYTVTRSQIQLTSIVITPVRWRMGSTEHMCIANLFLINTGKFSLKFFIGRMRILGNLL